MRSMIPHPETTCRYSRLRRESVLVVLLAIVASASESQAAPYTLTVTASHGSVVASPAKALYNEGEMVKLVPLPDAGYCSTGWSGDARSKSVVLNLTMNSNKAITANFGPWTPPIGVRIPEFGIFETYRM